MDGVTLYCHWPDCGAAWRCFGERARICPQCRRHTTWTVIPFKSQAERPVVEERPAILCLLIHKRTFKTAVVDLLELERWIAMGYVIVARDPFTMDAWNLWRRNNPEAS